MVLVMKKSILLPLLILTAIQLKAQEAVTFKMVYLPKTNYTITSEVKTNMNMAPVGQPMVMDMSMQSTSVIATGAADQSKTIPLKFSSKTGAMSMTMNGQQMPGTDAATQTVMYGKYTADGKMQIDSVAGKRLDDNTRNAMIAVINNVQNGLTFPDHPIKVGETFTRDTPFDMPLPGLASSAGNKATVKMTYKLLSITNNIAAFDLIEEVTVKTKQDAADQNLQLKIGGTGTGTITYDIKKQFFTTMTNNLNMDFDINVGGMSMKGKGVINTTSKTEIAGN
jgi:hypothetical protein